MIILVPSRGRPAQAGKMAASVRATSYGRVPVVMIIDADDPLAPEYGGGPDFDIVKMPERLGYVGSLNRVAPALWDQHTIIGAFGDDVLFRTRDWDRRVEEALAEPGIAYGDDLVHGRNHPTAVWMSSVIAKALGWLALPAVSHQWADDGWKRIGQVTGTLRFVEDVIVEHMHPAVQKAPWDETYDYVFDADRAAKDHGAFERWVAAPDGLAADSQRVIDAIRVAA